MKKHLTLFITLLLAMLLLFGCGAESTVSDKEEDSREDTAATEKSEETDDAVDIGGIIDEIIGGGTETPDAASQVSDSDFETRGYLYETMFGDSIYFLVVKNNSDAAVEINVSGIARDADGNELGTEETYINILGPGEETICDFYLSDITGVDTVECTYTYSSSYVFSPVLSDLDVKQTANEENITVEVTNNGEYCAQFVEAYALFFDADNNLIGYDSDYITDGDSEIKPGKTISSQLQCYEGYDHAEVYFTGKTDGSTVDMSKYISADNFSVEEYSYTSMFGDVVYFLAITNNSSETVSISANGTARDSEGKTVGAADMSINVLGPGEQSIGYFYFDGIGSYDKVEYELYCNTDVSYDPVISNLEVQQTATDDGVSVTVTNNGEYAAEFVEIYALFFDKNGNVVGHDSAYATDDDSEIKTGASITKELDPYTDFDSVKVFLTGRHSNW